VFHVEDHPQVLFVLLSSLVEGQQRRLLEREHGQSTHQRIRQTDVRFSGSGIANVVEGFTDAPEQSIRGKPFTRGGALGHHHTPFDRLADGTSACQMRAKGGPFQHILLASIASTASITKNGLEKPTRKNALVV
jgi:hypothetical protein